MLRSLAFAIVAQLFFFHRFLSQKTWACVFAAMTADTIVSNAVNECSVIVIVGCMCCVIVC